ncbi:MAG: hypothetical protein FWB96_04315 [Defluviitaleaceae bacterium]|nr:hypothetical protein [Defluviitaleaceae bacterium]MCL2262922.1 hypothetical protein [Defluviitaleaceae bacterium]
MTGISQGLMMGVISAQNSIRLAEQNQGLANQRYLAGRIRVRQGLTDGNQDMIEEGQRLQAEGKEMEFGTFEQLGNAMRNINDITADNRAEYDNSEDSCEENSQETQSVGDGSSAANRQSRIDITV